LLDPDWYNIGKKFLFLVGDHGFENQWTFVTSSSNRSSATGAEDRAASRRKALRLIFSKAFLAKVALCTIASISLISSMLHICFLWWLNWSAHSNRESFEKIVLAFERIVDDKERIEWEQLSERVNSTAFATSYDLTFFWGLLCKWESCDGKPIRDIASLTLPFSCLSSSLVLRRPQGLPSVP
jgi:hypothetical protein